MNLKRFQFIVISIFFLVSAGMPPHAFSQSEQDLAAKSYANAVEDLRPDWLYQELVSCPALKPGFQATSQGFQDGFCLEEMGACLSDCKANDAVACYSLALGIQSVDDAKVDLYEALFTRACRLGHASGCTNQGAGLSNADPTGEDKVAATCYIASYRAACKSKDPWGCTMLAFELYEGKHVAKDYEESLEVMSVSCQYGKEDPACSAALSLEELIEREKAEEK